MHKNQILQTNRFVPVLEKITQFSLLTFAVTSLFSISITQIAFTIGSLSWLLKVHLTKTWKELRGTMVGVAILCFCLACILSITTSVDMASSVKLLKKLIQFVIFFWVANSVQEEKQRSLLVVLVIASGVAAALGGVTPLLFDGSSDIFTKGIKGTLSKQSTYSGVLMMAGLMALAQCLFHKPKAYWVIGSIGLIAFAILCSLARQTWLGFLIGAVFLVFVWNKKYLLVLPLILLSLFLFSPDGVKKRILSLKNVNDLSLQHRAIIWKSGWRIFKDYPLTGCGYKCVDSIYRPSELPEDPNPWRNLLRYYVGMHSNIFQLLVDTGIVGFGAWIFIWITYFIEIFKRFRGLAEKTYRDRSKSLLMGPVAVVLSFLIGGFFETNFYDSEIAMLLYFIMGLSLAKVKNSTLQKISS